MNTSLIRRNISQYAKQLRYYANKFNVEQRPSAAIDEQEDLIYKQKADKQGLDKNKDQAREDRREFSQWSQGEWISDSFKEDNKDYNVEEKMADLKRGKVNRAGQAINEAEEYRDQ